MPVNLLNAFLEPVRFSRKQDVIGASIDKLVEHWQRVDEAYGPYRELTSVAAFAMPPHKLGYLEPHRASSLDKVVERTLAVTKAGLTVSRGERA